MVNLQTSFAYKTYTDKFSNNLVASNLQKVYPRDKEARTLVRGTRTPEGKLH